MFIKGIYGIIYQMNNNIPPGSAEDQIFDSLVELRKKFGITSMAHKAQWQTRALLERHKNAREVARGQGEISSSPLVSYAYGFCRALVTRTGGKMGLFHLILDQDPTEFAEYIERTLRSATSGIIVAPDEDPSLKQTCEEHGIHIVETVVFDGQNLRDVVTVPKSGDMVVNSSDGAQLVRTIRDPLLSS